jgi:hypothetical protein
MPPDTLIIVETSTGSPSIKIDPAQVSEGSYISAEDVEAASGIERDDPRFQFLLLRLYSQLSSDLETEGRPFMVKQEGRGIRVLGASEAMEYGHRLYLGNLNRAERAHTRTVAAVAHGLASLSDDEKRRNERLTGFRAAQLASIDAASKKYSYTLPEDDRRVREPGLPDKPTK